MADKEGVIGENTIFTVEVWMNNTVKRMMSNLAKSRANNSGTLRQSLGQNLQEPVKVKGGILTGTIKAEDYWEAVDKGRKPSTGGSKPGKLYPSILKWVKTKLPTSDIPDRSLAFIITRKIHEKGTKGNQFASKVLTPKRIKDLEDSIAKAMAEDLRISIINAAK